ncbi:furin (paired basic amino acid cleaving enzyme) b isoform X1 [Hypomesus transpacificus]|uniref:furin (paired basic amino acid cleaving enzyme) b isoform X1 n=1 Tax=Hypomesus transpacificus TaxID=137520 RepID=UPI001F078C9A|nr:furin (paired basic amino acid cleaving enzyme) b isoform X1 [Hypomesus transpacificus]XP_046890415.1 furin (paired basic amino acid cleaving enzyme) b isoform X1 [Hypomesus transpacificus]XP_046890417.1 furin (paired basic amino acid cleaving enzyme) b isoform X1 [Hypomesus transpacificus]
MEAQLVLLQLGAALVLLTTVPQTNAAGQVYTNTWAVRIQGGPEQADLVARKHGFVNHGNVFGDYYHFRHHSVAKRSLSGHSRTHALLQEEPQVQWTEQQVAKPRKKRDIYEAPSDPKFSEQWYLSSPSHQDLNTREAWAQGYTGRGVVVTILDDGIEKDHPDLAPNYDPDASYDVNDGDSDPQPRYTQRNENRHGTRCAGEVAASANNGVCGVGVAYNARIGGVRMLDGEVTDVVEAHSLSMNSQHVHVYSASWGPEDDGKTVDGPAKLAKEAFLRGVTEGRGGLGSIFVWASGNGGRERDSCNCDGYTNSIYTLSISSTTQYGNVPWYSEACSSTLATTYSSGNPGEKQIVTTDLRQKCTDSHTGTSASAPLAAGIIALALEANANLTWRDMQHLVVRTSQPAHLSADDWKTNGMGRRVSHSYGYGLLDAGAMVALAQNWTSVGPQHQCVLTMLSEPREMGSRLVFSRSVDACWGRPEYVSSLEHVQARLSLSYTHRGSLAIHLSSPLGTRSTLLADRPKDSSSEGFNDWAFMTTHSWDEDPRGEWTLEIENMAGGERDYGMLTQFSLILYGTGSSAISPSSPDFPRPSNNSCKTFDAQQICIECSPGFSLFLQGCVKMCPPGFTSGPQLLNLSLETWVDLSSVQACLPCNAACLTCAGPGPSDCLSCPPHSHLVLSSCPHQNQVQRKSPISRLLPAEDSHPAGESSAGGGGGGEAQAPGPGPSPSSSPVPTKVAVLSCAFILAAFGGLFLLLQLRSGGAPWAWRSRLRAAEGGGFRLGSGLGRGWERKTRVCYKGIPTVWGDEDMARPSEESDSEEPDSHSERTAFIRTQSSL